MEAKKKDMDLSLKTSECTQTQEGPLGKKESYITTYELVRLSEHSERN